jgi:hypothetical protein
MGTEGYFPRDKVAESEADHSLTTSTEVKNGEVIPPLPKHLHGMLFN